MKDGSPNLGQSWRLKTAGIFAYPPHAIKVRAPVLDISSSPMIVYPGREASGVAPLGLDPDDVPSGMVLQTVAHLDPSFRPDNFPQDIDFVIESRLYPEIHALKKGDWLCVTFLYDRKSYGIASVEKIDAGNVLTLNSRRKSEGKPGRTPEFN